MTYSLYSIPFGDSLFIIGEKPITKHDGSYSDQSIFPMIQVLGNENIQKSYVYEKSPLWGLLFSTQGVSRKEDFERMGGDKKIKKELKKMYEKY